MCHRCVKKLLLSCCFQLLTACLCEKELTLPLRYHPRVWTEYTPRVYSVWIVISIIQFIKRRDLTNNIKFKGKRQSDRLLSVVVLGDVLFMSCEQVINACPLCEAKRLWKACTALEYFKHPGTAFYGRGLTWAGHFLCSIYRVVWISTSTATCDCLKETRKPLLWLCLLVGIVNCI